MLLIWNDTSLVTVVVIALRGKGGTMPLLLVNGQSSNVMHVTASA